MKQLLLIALACVCPYLLLAQSSSATANNGASAGPMIVATKDTPPFAFKDPDGKWTGITIDLWEGIANELGYDYEYREYDLVGVLGAVQTGEANIGAAAISVTADRAKAMSFTHTYYGSSLGIATAYTKQNIWTELFSRLLNWNFIKALLALLVVLLLAGLMVWLFERKRNAEHFGGNTAHGLGAAFWWSAVTMTTVGYGDKAPVTLGGRLIGLVWMFTSIVIISGLTGAIATALTVGSLTPKVKGPQDLIRVRVGTIEDSVADHYLKAIGVYPQYFETIPDGLRAVSDSEISAFVNDHALISYWAGKDFAGEIDVLTDTFEPTFLALAMPLEQVNQREIDLELLEFIQSPAWDAILTKYRASQ
ncbi:MAG: transporter substrate-binding domain-containing protein [Verrucomicrobiota bacterium]